MDRIFYRTEYANEARSMRIILLSLIVILVLSATGPNPVSALQTDVPLD